MVMVPAASPRPWWGPAPGPAPFACQSSWQHWNFPPMVWVLVGVAVLCLWLFPVAVLGSSPCTPRFSAGDVVMIQPQNQPEDVQQFCQLLCLEPHRRFVLEPTEPGRSCLLLLPLPAETGHPLSSGPAWSSALPLL